MYKYSLFYIIIAIFTCILRAVNHRVQEASSSNLDTRTKTENRKVFGLFLCLKENTEINVIPTGFLILQKSGGIKRCDKQLPGL